MPKAGVPLPNLRAWRVHALLSQHKLAGEANVGPATIARLETGGRADPLTVQHLANALNIRTHQLIHDLPE